METVDCIQHALFVRFRYALNVVFNIKFWEKNKKENNNNKFPKILSATNSNMKY